MIGTNEWRNRLRLRLTSEQWRDALVPALTVAAALIGSKGFKALSSLALRDELLGVSRVKRGLELIAAIGAVIVLRVLLKRGVNWRWFAAAAALTLAAAIVHDWHVIAQGMQHVHEFLFIFRWDVFVAIVFTFVAIFSSSRKRGIVRSASLIGLGFVAFSIAAVSGLELAYFRATGMLGDGGLAKYWIANFSNVAFIVQSELSLPNVAIIALFLAFLPLSYFGLRTLRARPWLERCAEASPSAIGPGAVLLALALMPGNHGFPALYGRLVNSFPVRLVSDLVADPYWRMSSEQLRRSTALPPIADTRRLRLTPDANSKRMNVVILILESTRARSTTPYNPGLQTTPFLDQLARKSLLVDNMYTVVPQTCSAWTAILTGLYPVTSDISTWTDAGESGAGLASLPKMLRANGYRSAFFTPSHMKFENDYALIKNRGFDTMRYEGTYPTDGFERPNYFGYEDRIMFRPSLDWVDSSDRPFFLVYMTLAPHHNYQTPSTFHKIQYPGANQTDYNDYLNAIRYQDDWMRDLFAEFERRGLMSSTLFVILGDHGESFGEHGERTHLQILYEEALHIPGLLYAPSLWSEGGHVTGLRQEIDVLPTVAEVLGLKLEDGFVPGTSLLKPVPGDRTLYFSATRENTGMALTRGSMKYIYFFRHEPMQVYDLANDPLEQRDLGPTLADAERDRVEQELVDWRQRAVNVFLNKDATAPAKSVQAALH